jgi:hypothetical protein
MVELARTKSTPETKFLKNWLRVSSLIRAAKKNFPVPVGQTQVLAETPPHHPGEPYQEVGFGV